MIYYYFLYQNCISILSNILLLILNVNIDSTLFCKDIDLLLADVLCVIYLTYYKILNIINKKYKRCAHKYDNKGKV